MTPDDFAFADQLDRRWDLYILARRAGAHDAEATADIGSTHDAAIHRLHALDTPLATGSARERVWQSVTTHLAQENATNITYSSLTAFPARPSNGHHPQTVSPHPPATLAELTSSRRRWWPVVEFAAMIAVVAVLVTAFATGGRFFPSRSGSQTPGSTPARIGDGALVTIPPAKDPSVEVILRRLSFPPGASLKTVPGATVVTLVESGALVFESATGKAQEGAGEPGSLVYADESLTIRNDSAEPASALQGVILAGAMTDAAPPGVVTQVLAQHMTDSLPAGTVYVHLDRVSLAPAEAFSNPLPGEAGFVPMGNTVMVTAVESGSLTFSADEGKSLQDATVGGEMIVPNVNTGATGGGVVAAGGVSSGDAFSEEAGHVAGSAGGVSTTGDTGRPGVVIADAPPAGEAAGAGAEPVNGTTVFGIAEPAAGTGAISGGANAKNETGLANAEAGASSGGGGSGLVVTDTATNDLTGSITVTPDESAAISKLVPANTSGAVESAGTITLHNTGLVPAVAVILTIVPVATSR